MEQTIACKLCGHPYKVFMHTVADQSACPRCISQAEMMRPVKLTANQLAGMRALSKEEIKANHLKNAKGFQNAIVRTDV